MFDADAVLLSKLFAELCLVNTDENELKASPALVGLIQKDEELPLLIDEDLEYFSSFAVPKSARTKCQDSLNRKLPGFRSL